MTFEFPWLLFFLAIPFLILLWQWRRKIHQETLNLGKIQSRGTLPKVRRKIFLSLGLFFVVFSFSRPQWGMRDEQVFDQSREVLIAVDLSRSMLSVDLAPTRLDRAKIMIEGLLEQLKGERIGLLLFAGTAYLQSPLSPDYEIIRELVPTLNPDWMPQGGTDYTQMLKVAGEAFEAGQASDRFLIILSDGESTTEGWEKEAEKLKNQGVRVIGLGTGTEAGSVVPSRSGGYTKDDRGAVVISKLEPKTLQELAKLTHGIYRDAAQWVDLHSLVQETVEKGKQGKFQEKRHEKKIERFQWFLSVGFLFLLLSFIYEMPVRIRPRAMKVSNLLLLFLIGGSLWLHAEEPARPPNPLVQEVARLAGESKVKPQEWASLAEKTIQSGSSNPELPEGVVDDALSGVTKGEKQDSQAADWKKLRSTLEAMRQKKDSQKNNQDQQNQKNNSSQKKDSSSKDSSSSPNNSSGQQDQQQNNSPKGEDPSKTPPDQKNNPLNNPQNDSEKKQNDSKSQDSQKEGASEKNEKPGEQAGDSNENKENGKTQKVGGAKRDLDSKKTDKISREQLIQLNQIKEGDSPATLFQVLEGKSKSQGSPSKDW
ncbi:MAG: VWA domain-containing protein [Verrucomicrobiota bacterium]